MEPGMGKESDYQKINVRDPLVSLNTLMCLFEINIKIIHIVHERY